MPAWGVTSQHLAALSSLFPTPASAAGTVLPAWTPALFLGYPPPPACCHLGIFSSVGREERAKPSPTCDQADEWKGGIHQPPIPCLENIQPSGKQSQPR